ncbi:MAG TPA: hypothetical protein PK280_11335 [Planctomycetota bacterium]|nr:hypothetical protein [Planctomycetota bacterium]
MISIARSPDWRISRRAKRTATVALLVALAMLAGVLAVAAAEALGDRSQRMIGEQGAKGGQEW